MCVCAGEKVCVWLTHSAAASGNYIVCLSGVIAVPVFVVPRLWHAGNVGNAVMAFSRLLTETDTVPHNADVRVCVSAAGGPIVGYANVCERMQEFWDSPRLLCAAAQKAKFLLESVILPHQRASKSTFFFMMRNANTAAASVDERLKEAAKANG